jgi:hypothetical protein
MHVEQLPPFPASCNGQLALTLAFVELRRSRRVAQTIVEDHPGDMAWGVEEIAAAIERGIRPTYHMLAKGELPARKVGGRWVASKRKLRAFLCGEDA